MEFCSFRALHPEDSKNLENLPLFEQLTSVIMEGCVHVTDFGIWMITKACPNLTKVQH